MKKYILLTSTLVICGTSLAYAGYDFDTLRIEDETVETVSSLDSTYYIPLYDTTNDDADVMAVTDIPGMGAGSTNAEIDRVADVSSRIVTLVADGAVTESVNEGKINLLGEVGGNASLTVTLPAATGGGACYHFKVSVVNTSNYVIQVVGNDTMDGHIVSLADGGDTTVGWETASDSDTITMNATTKGGVSIGDWVELCDTAADQWSVTGVTTSSGTEATPFSAAI